MSFLTPLYLIGALGLAIPIILHLLHDRPKNKQAFGSLMFLDKTKPPVDRKRRPTHLLLLLLRCLALLLLAFVFARFCAVHSVFFVCCAMSFPVCQVVSACVLSNVVCAV